MKSVLNNIFACCVLTLTAVAAQAALPVRDDATTCALTRFDAWKNTSQQLQAEVASNDDDQADSSDADTMLA